MKFIDALAQYLDGAKPAHFGGLDLHLRVPASVATLAFEGSLREFFLHSQSFFCPLWLVSGQLGNGLN
jgi:hypothetical protein